MYSPPEGKFSIPITLFEVGMCLPTTDFFNMIIWEYEFSAVFPTILTLKHFFNTSTQSGTRTLSRCQGVPTLIHDKKSKKNCVTSEDWFDCFLAADGTSSAWRGRGKILEFFFKKEGMEDTISLEKALRGLFDGELQVCDVDLVEALPPYFSVQRIMATAGS
ncbi:unnamed protein product [Lactuca saligna]|uniref:Uncharacterized protein n=1 Tax=Lactuca saligna TaxID=75948 RepID=A0AA36E107_LACSI|nr:unnamed protein product [Lactuca saligna]